MSVPFRCTSISTISTLPSSELGDDTIFVELGDDLTIFVELGDLADRALEVGLEAVRAVLEHVLGCDVVTPTNRSVSLFQKPTSTVLPLASMTSTRRPMPL